MFGKKVCASKLKVKVKSYNRRNGTRVRRYSRKQPSESPKNVPPKIISFKKLLAAPGSTRESVNLAHSLYIKDLQESIHNVGKSGTTDK